MSFTYCSLSIVFHFLSVTYSLQQIILFLLYRFLFLKIAAMLAPILFVNHQEK